MKLCFVFPRFKYPSGDFSIGLASLAGFVKQQVPDVEISCIDTSFHPSFEYVKEKLTEYQPDVVCIYSDTIMFKDAKDIALMSREMKIFTVMGGPHPTLFTQEVSRYCDLVIQGEGENKLTYLVKNFNEVKETRVIPPQPQVDLEQLPPPLVEMFDVEVYIKNFIQLDSYKNGLRGLSVVASRGCPFRCAYCQPTLQYIFGSKVRIKTPQQLHKEITILKEKYSINAFYFQDDTFTAFPDWIKTFCKLIKKENLKWACNTRADTITKELLKEMKDAGLVKVKVGVEAYADRIRNGIYHKGISIKQVDALVKNCKELQIQIAGFFMLGGPTETKEEIKQTISYARSSGFDEATFSITTPLPCTDLYSMAKDKGWHLPTDYDNYDYYKAARPKITDSDLSNKELERLKKIAFFTFYLHPKRLFNTIRITFSVRKTWNKLKRLI